MFFRAASEDWRPRFCRVCEWSRIAVTIVHNVPSYNAIVQSHLLVNVLDGEVKRRRRKLAGDEEFWIISKKFANKCREYKASSLHLCQRNSCTTRFIIYHLKFYNSYFVSSWYEMKKKYNIVFLTIFFACIFCIFIFDIYK